jgi:hypothetical protein
MIGTVFQTMRSMPVSHGSKPAVQEQYYRRTVSCLSARTSKPHAVNYYIDGTRLDGERITLTLKHQYSFNTNRGTFCRTLSSQEVVQRTALVTVTRWPKTPAQQQRQVRLRVGPSYMQFHGNLTEYRDTVLHALRARSVVTLILTSYRITC